MSEIASGAFFSLTLFVGLIVAIEGGRRIRLHSSRQDGPTGLGTIESAVFGMLALLLAFAFNGAASRFDVRRQLVVDEVNAISSAHQRLDLLTPETRGRLHAIIYFMFGLIAVVAALMAGYAMGASDTRTWLHIIGFAAVLAIMAYVIVDLEYPRLGRFQIVEFDRMLADLRSGMR